MKNAKKSKLPTKLSRARFRFEKWRSTHKPRTRLPDHLWALATDLAREYGISQTVQILRVDYYGLKKRLKLSVAAKTSPAAPSQPFLEFLPAVTDATIECTIECEDASGSRIRIHLKGRELPDLVALGNSLWSSKR